jgi:hypothetical protein
VVRVSGSAGGDAAGPERAAAAPAAEVPHQPDKRRAEDDAADADAGDRGAPSAATPGKRHRAAAAGAPSGDEAVTAHAALGAAEAEARCGAGEANEKEAGAALRRLGVRETDPRFAAALAHERAAFAEQVRGNFARRQLAALQRLLFAGLLHARRQRVAVHATHVGSAGHAVVSLTRQGQRALQCDTPH